MSQDASGRWSKVEFNVRGMPSVTCDVGLNPQGTQAGCPSDANTVSRTLETDAWGNAVSERRGNSAAMDVKRSYSVLTGRLESLCAGDASTCNLMKELYAWDAAGNLHTQQKENRYLETFTYDSLNRLVEGRQAMRDGVPIDLVTQRFVYDLLGNVCRKDDRTYRYDGNAGCGAGGLEGNGSASTSGPHRVAETVLDGGGSVFYYYDARGNQTVRDEPGTANDRTAYYSVDDLAYEIALGNGTRTRFWYGSDGQRYKREDGTKKTLYLGNVEIVVDAGVTTIKRTLGGVLLQQIVGTSVTKRYLFHDRLGSLVRTTTETGAVFNNMDFAAYGARRSHLTGTGSGAAPSLTTRGFTGHEHVDAVGVIHMNGRIYDPALGRFLQVDPFIQDPENPQSWNAYTYVFNNPLRYTDPSGMLGVEERQWLGAIAAIVVIAIGHPEGLGEVLAWSTVAGFVGGAISTQSFRGGVLGAMTAAVTAGIGGAAAAAGPFARIGMMALTGGVMARLQGGDFGSAFLSAGLTAAFMPNVGAITNDVGRTLVGALVGGTISELSGGKFANGAINGAIQAAMMGGQQRVTAVGSGTDSTRDDVELPGAVRIEGGGFDTQQGAVAAAARRYFAEGVERRQELQLGLGLQPNGKWAYYTPGWGPKGVSIIDNSRLFSMYERAGLRLDRWLHGHFDSQLNFSATDFAMAWNQSWSQSETFMVNRNGEGRVLTQSYLESMARGLPKGYSKDLSGSGGTMQSPASLERSYEPSIEIVRSAAIDDYRSFLFLRA